jgi:hypothetical protein
VELITTKENKLPSFMDRSEWPKYWKLWLSKNKEVVLPLHNEFIHLCHIKFPRENQIRMLLNTLRKPNLCDPQPSSAASIGNPFWLKLWLMNYNWIELSYQ